MKGSYRIVISNAKVQYDFTVHRNITIIKGDSATGKTTLVEMVREHYDSGESSGIILTCERPCRGLSGRDWKLVLSALQGHIIFIDEDNAFLPTDEFAQAVRESDNYYVIVTREGLPKLPYSVQEIYGIRESGKYASLKKIYQEFCHIYGRTNFAKPVSPEYVLVEDSNSGFEFFDGLSKKKDYTVISSEGKSNIFAAMLKFAGQRLLIIADGAAFGPEMDRVMKQAGRQKETVLYLPESFEWLVLKSGIIGNRELNAVLEMPEYYIESSRFFSWERFFTDLLVQFTKDTYLKYSKRKLNAVYLREDMARKITGQMDGIELI